MEYSIHSYSCRAATSGPCVIQYRVLSILSSRVAQDWAWNMAHGMRMAWGRGGLEMFNPRGLSTVHTVTAQGSPPGD